VSRNSKTRIGTRRRHSKFAWLFGATAAVCALLYWEQTALLYVLSTLAMCGLLLVVAFSKLEARDEELHSSASAEAVDIPSTQSSDLASTEERAA
jgi:Flp pilus assembly protein TadB